MSAQLNNDELENQFLATSNYFVEAKPTSTFNTVHIHTLAHVWVSVNSKEVKTYCTIQYSACSMQACIANAMFVDNDEVQIVGKG